MFWILGNMLNSIVSNSHFGKRSVTWEITILRPHFLPHVTNKVFFLINEIFVSRAPGHLQG